MNIEYPKKTKNEAEVQALLWYFLRKHKIDARLEVAADKARLDIVCFRDKKAVCIIECKAWTHSYSQVHKYRHNNTRQLNKYRSLFGIPVLVCGNVNQITTTQSEVLALFGYVRKTVVV